MDDYSDFKELGIDVEEEDPLTRKFNKCAKHIQGIAGTIENDNLLKLYGLYKQSLEGPCDAPRPSWYDLKGKSKWEAWKSLGNLDQTEAKSRYIELVLELSPKFSLDEASSKTESWVRVSSLAQEAGPQEKTIRDHIRSGEIQRVLTYLKESPQNKDSLDADGMGLIHYACDIGNTKILELLVKEGCDINLQDLEGQTGLHYAGTCGHLDCVRALVALGADVNIKDAEGLSPEETASDDSIRTILRSH